MTDADLLECATEFRSGILGDGDSTRMCFAVCAPLQGYLAFTGLETKLVNGNIEGWDHCWLELEDGRILDPTADQFPNLRKGAKKPMPDVYLGKRPKWYSLTPLDHVGTADKPAPRLSSEMHSHIQSKREAALCPGNPGRHRPK